MESIDNKNYAQTLKVQSHENCFFVSMFIYQSLTKNE